MEREFKVGDIVNLTSKRFGYSDPEQNQAEDGQP